MGSGVLSQEEIDALLRGDPANAVSTPGETVPLSPMEIDALGEVANISMGAAATTLSTLLGKRVEITTPKVKLTTRDKLQCEYPLPYLVIKVHYTSGLEGFNLLVLNERDAAVIADLMMGGDGEAPTDILSEIYISAVGEAMNQMMGTASTSMSQMFSKTVNISPPDLERIDFGQRELNQTLDPAYDDLAQISFRMTIEHLIDSELMQIVPVVFAQNMTQGLIGGLTANEPLTPSAAPPPSSKIKPATPGRDPSAAEEKVNWPESERPRAPGLGREQPNGGQVMVQPIQFSPLDSGPPGPGAGNINLILDVPLQLTVELGKTRKTIKEILELGAGSIIELNKLAGEPVDLLINGKLIAHGEVVVIDENYGVRVTDIVSPVERMTSLQ